MNTIKRIRIFNEAMQKYQKVCNYAILPAGLLASYVTKDPVFAEAGICNALGTYTYRFLWEGGYENLTFGEFQNLPGSLKLMVGSRSNYNDSFPISRREIIYPDFYV